MEFLRLFPFWFWVLAPAVCLGLILYAVNRDARNALKISGIACAASVATACFHLWENYLLNHFVGRYSDLGMPSQFSRSGWYLLIDVWPMWVMPAVFFVVLTATICLIVQRYYDQLETDGDVSPRAQFSSTKMISRRIDNEEYEKKFLVMQDKYQRLKDRAVDRELFDAINDECTYMRDQMTLLRRENEVLLEQNSTLRSSLSEATAQVNQLRHITGSR